MFRECSSLNDITPLKNWDVSKGVSFIEFFKNCYSLYDISPIKNWNVANGKSFISFLENCIKITDITPLDNWNVSKNADCTDLYKDTSIKNTTSSSWYSKYK